MPVRLTTKSPSKAQAAHRAKPPAVKAATVAKARSTHDRTAQNKWHDFVANSSAYQKYLGLDSASFDNILSEREKIEEGLSAQTGFINGVRSFLSQTTISDVLFVGAAIVTSITAIHSDNAIEGFLSFANNNALEATAIVIGALIGAIAMVIDSRKRILDRREFIRTAEQNLHYLETIDTPQTIIEIAQEHPDVMHDLLEFLGTEEIPANMLNDITPAQLQQIQTHFGILKQIENLKAEDFEIYDAPFEIAAAQSKRKAIEESVKEFDDDVEYLQEICSTDYDASHVQQQIYALSSRLQRIHTQIQDYNDLVLQWCETQDTLEEYKAKHAEIEQQIQEHELFFTLNAQTDYFEAAKEKTKQFADVIAALEGSLNLTVKLPDANPHTVSDLNKDLTDFEAAATQAVQDLAETKAKIIQERREQIKAFLNTSQTFTLASAELLAAELHEAMPHLGIIASTDTGRTIDARIGLARLQAAARAIGSHIEGHITSSSVKVVHGTHLTHGVIHMTVADQIEMIKLLGQQLSLQAARLKDNELDLELIAQIASDLNRLTQSLQQAAAEQSALIFSEHFEKLPVENRLPILSRTLNDILRSANVTKLKAFLIDLEISTHANKEFWDAAALENGSEGSFLEILSVAQFHDNPEIASAIKCFLKFSLGQEDTFTQTKPRQPQIA